MLQNKLLKPWDHVKARVREQLFHALGKFGTWENVVVLRFQLEMRFVVVEIQN
jgi:hypothetical protein